MRILSVALKDLKEILRDKRSLFFILVFPMLFMLVFGFAFGDMGEQTEPHDIAVVNYDQGYVLNGENVAFGNNLTTFLSDVKYQNSDINMFNVKTTTESSADDMVKDRTIDAEVIIPSDFSKSISGLILNKLGSSGVSSTGNMSNNIVSTVKIRGDVGYSGFGTSEGMLVGVLRGFQDGIISGIQSKITGATSTNENVINTEVEGVSGTESFTNFDFIAPGMIVFAILLLATSVATILTKETETGTLRRLKLSKMTTFDYLFGGLIPWSLIAVLQVLILFVVALAIGFHWQGGITSLLLAILVGIIGGISSIALGMIIASFAKDAKQASNLGTLIVVPLSFIVGSFFQLPQVVIGNFMGQSIQIYDLLPWTHTLTALRKTLIYGSSWNAISFNVMMSLILTIILFIIGLMLFSKNRLKSDI